MYVNTTPLVDFDSGSSDFFLPGAACTFSCAGHKIFDTAASNTAIDQYWDVQLAYGDGSTIEGNVFKDTVTLAGLTVTNQDVVVASYYSEGFKLFNFSPDGLMGMAFQSLAETKGNPVIMSLISQGETTESVFGVTLRGDGGELFIGGTDTGAFIGNLSFAPLITEPAFWEISVAGASVGNTQVVTEAQDAIVDTGTTFLIVDDDSANKIFAQIPGAASAANTVGEGFFTIPCDGIPSDISIDVAGKSFTLPPDAIKTGQLTQGSNECVAGIMAEGSIGELSCSEQVIRADSFSRFLDPR